MDVLGEAVAANPSDVALFAEYVTALVASGRAEDGIPLATQALEGRSGAGRAHVLAQRARLLTAAGDTHAAVQDLERMRTECEEEKRKLHNELVEAVNLLIEHKEGITETLRSLDSFMDVTLDDLQVPVE